MILVGGRLARAVVQRAILELLLGIPTRGEAIARFGVPLASTTIKVMDFVAPQADRTERAKLTI
jgi:hypothetical protein